ncbi:MAG: 1-acyl-sn-glycerol-3-phosphate acyltransferase [Armatimonadetes bacterium]|nr:1-acyl-sn-glycerol-3-phosphate acyltransferase [Armatimonadota bacterium]
MSERRVTQVASPYEPTTDPGVSRDTPAATLLFLVKSVPAGLWFFSSCVYGFFMSLLRFRDPSNGKRFGRVCAWGARRFLGLKVQVLNEERLYDNQPCVYVANHQSDIDLFVYGQLYPTRTIITGKKEVLLVPFFGIMFYAMGNILIDRKRRDRAVASLQKAAQIIREKSVSIWVFPEGTRNPNRPMRPFKKGAFHLAVEAQVPIVPVAQSLQQYAVDPKRLRAPGGLIQVRILEPISTAGMTADDVDRLMEVTRTRMDEALAEADAAAAAAAREQTA